MLIVKFTLTYQFEYPYTYLSFIIFLETYS